MFKKKSNLNAIEFFTLMALAGCAGDSTSGNSGGNTSENPSNTSGDGGGNTSSDGGGNTSSDGGGNTSSDGGGNTSSDGGGNTSSDGGGNTSSDGGNPSAEPSHYVFVTDNSKVITSIALIDKDLVIKDPISLPQNVGALAVDQDCAVAASDNTVMLLRHKAEGKLEPITANGNDMTSILSNINGISVKSIKKVSLQAKQKEVLVIALGTDKQTADSVLIQEMEVSDGQFTAKNSSNFTAYLDTSTPIVDSSAHNYFVAVFLSSTDKYREYRIHRYQSISQSPVYLTVKQQPAGLAVLPNGIVFAVFRQAPFKLLAIKDWNNPSKNLEIPLPNESTGVAVGPNNLVAVVGTGNQNTVSLFAWEETKFTAKATNSKLVDPYQVAFAGHNLLVLTKDSLSVFEVSPHGDTLTFKNDVNVSFKGRGVTTFTVAEAVK